jgi:eukaryotic-like serine/threonine-protein kinase
MSAGKKIGRSIHFLIIFGLMSGFFLLFLNYVAMPFYAHRKAERTLVSVTGLSWEKAISLLEREGFVAMRGETREDTLPPYTVISQSPRAGKKVKQGRRVYLTLSTPQGKRSFPNLVGYTERAARLELDRLNISIDTLYWEYSSLPKGNVTRHIPAADSTIYRDVKAVLYLSLGIDTRMVSVPDLIFKGENEAIELIKDSGLKLGSIEYEINDEILPYLVLEQSLKANGQVLRGTAIHLIVSKEP